MSYTTLTRVVCTGTRKLEDDQPCGMEFERREQHIGFLLALGYCPIDEDDGEPVDHQCTHCPACGGRLEVCSEPIGEPVDVE